MLLFYGDVPQDVDVFTDSIFINNVNNYWIESHFVHGSLLISRYISGLRMTMHSSTFALFARIRYDSSSN